MIRRVLLTVLLLCGCAFSQQWDHASGRNQGGTTSISLNAEHIGLWIACNYTGAPCVKRSPDDQRRVPMLLLQGPTPVDCAELNMEPIELGGDCELYHYFTPYDPGTPLYSERQTSMPWLNIGPEWDYAWRINGQEPPSYGFAEAIRDLAETAQ